MILSGNNFLSRDKYCNDCNIIRDETTFPPGRIKRNCAINNLIRGIPPNFIICILHYSLCDLLHSLIKCIWFFSVVLLCHRRRMIHKYQKPFQSFTTISNSSHWIICHSVNIKTSDYFRFCSPETVSPLTHRNKLHSEGHALFFLFAEVSTFFHSQSIELQHQRHLEVYSFLQVIYQHLSLLKWYDLCLLAFFHWFISNNNIYIYNTLVGNFINLTGYMMVASFFGKWSFAFCLPVL